MSDRTKNLEDIARRAARLAEEVMMEEDAPETLWREARDLLAQISQHEVIHSDDLMGLTQYH